MKISETLMTPADAARLLEKNTRNRKLSRARVNVLKAIIERGEWVFDGNPIKIAEDGTVIDGQHRLAAISEAATEGVPTILIAGLASTARLAIDSGRARSFADYLHMAGVPNDLSMAAAVRGVWNYTNGMFDWRGDWFSRPSPSYSQLWELYEKRRPDFEDGVSHSNQVIRVIRVARAPMAAAWLILGDVECANCGSVAGDREEFYAQLAMRDEAGHFDTINQFIRMMNSRGGTISVPGRAKYSQRDQLALLIKTWNAYRTGNPPRALYFRGGGKEAERFPVPH